jgi:uncharacterized membrane protein
VSNRKRGHPPARRNSQPQQPPPPTALQVIQQQAVWQGPIPSPDDLRGYEEVQAGLAERIVVMAEKQVSMAERQEVHRHAMEHRMVFGMSRRATLGLWLAFVLAVFVFAGSMWLIDKGHDLAGGVLAAGDLAGLLGTFVYGRWDQRRQEERREQGG